MYATYRWTIFPTQAYTHSFCSIQAVEYTWFKTNDKNIMTSKILTPLKVGIRSLGTQPVSYQTSDLIVLGSHLNTSGAIQ